MTSREAAAVLEAADAIKAVLEPDGVVGKAGEWKRRWQDLGRVEAELRAMVTKQRTRSTEVES